MTEGSTLPKSSPRICVSNTRIRNMDKMESRIEAVSSWPAASPACSLFPFPIYWLMITAPPAASATNRFRKMVLKELTKETPETAASLTNPMTKTSAIPTRATRSCSRNRGMMSCFRLWFENIRVTLLPMLSVSAVRKHRIRDRKTGILSDTCILK